MDYELEIYSTLINEQIVIDTPIQIQGWSKEISLRNRLAKVVNCPTCRLLEAGVFSYGQPSVYPCSWTHLERFVEEGLGRDMKAHVSSQSFLV